MNALKPIRRPDCTEIYPHSIRFKGRDAGCLACGQRTQNEESERIGSHLNTIYHDHAITGMAVIFSPDISFIERSPETKKSILQWAKDWFSPQP